MRKFKTGVVPRLESFKMISVAPTPDFSALLSNHAKWIDVIEKVKITGVELPN